MEMPLGDDTLEENQFEDEDNYEENYEDYLENSEPSNDYNSVIMIILKMIIMTRYL